MLVMITSMVAMVVIMMPISMMMFHLVAALMACVVTSSASLMACGHLFNLWTFFFSTLANMLRILRILFVHPIEVELGTFLTICTFAFEVACLDGRKVFASFC